MARAISTAPKRHRKTGLPVMAIGGLQLDGELVSPERAIHALSKKVEALIEFMTSHNTASGFGECYQCGQFRPNSHTLMLPTEFKHARLCADRLECAANFIAGEEGDRDELLSRRLLEIATTTGGHLAGCWSDSHRCHAIWRVWSKELEGFPELAIEYFARLP